MPIRVKVVYEPEGSYAEHKSITLPDSGGVIGRNRGCDLIFHDESRYVSSRHVELKLEGDRLLVIDHSSNGTYVNQEYDPIGKGNTVEIRSGDHLMVGDFVVEVFLDGAGEDATPTPTTPPAAAAPMAASGGDDDLDDLLSSLGQPSAGAPEAAPPARPAASGDPTMFAPLTDEDRAKLEQAEAPPQRGDSGDATMVAPLTPEELEELNAAKSPESPSDDVTAVSEPPPPDAPSGTPEAGIPDDVDFLGVGSPSSGAEPNEDDLLSSFGAPKPPPPAAKDAEAPAHAASKPPLQQERPEEDLLADFSPPAQADPAPADPMVAMDATPAPEPASEPPAEAQPDPEPEPAPPPAPPATSAASEPPATPSFQPPAAAAGDERILEALLEGLGLPREDIDTNDPALLARTVGTALKESVAALMLVMRQRAEIKNEMRMAATSIMPAQNNPLKFSIDEDEAMMRFFGKLRRGYLGPSEAIKKAVEDIHAHHTSSQEAMRKAVGEVLAELAPERIEELTQGQKRGLLGGNPQAKAWQQYCEVYEDLCGGDGDKLQSKFSEAYSKGYNAV